MEDFHVRVHNQGIAKNDPYYLHTALVVAVWLAFLIVILFGVGVAPFSAYGQDGPNVNLSQGPPMAGFIRSLYYDATTGSLAYVCYAKANQSSLIISTGTISAATNATPVVLTSTGHNFPLGAIPKVTISGATGNWTPINGAQAVTVIDANAFSVAVDSTAFGALTGTVKFTTTYPRLNQTVWAILRQAYNGSTQLVGAFFANGSSAMDKACSLKDGYYY